MSVGVPPGVCASLSVRATLSVHANLSVRANLRALGVILSAIMMVLVPFVPHEVGAKEAVPTEMDRVQQKRAVELSEHLRCLVCQNQTIADSNAELAQDLRRQVREQITQGKSDSQIIDFMVQRYGDFVLYKPPVKATTLLLWFGPLLLLLLAIFALARHVRMRNRRAEPAPLSEAEHEKARRLLDLGLPAGGVLADHVARAGDTSKTGKASKAGKTSKTSKPSDLGKGRA